jgi:hypothetical protein
MLGLGLRKKDVGQSAKETVDIERKAKGVDEYR